MSEGAAAALHPPPARIGRPRPFFAGLRCSGPNRPLVVDKPMNRRIVENISRPNSPRPVGRPPTKPERPKPPPRRAAHGSSSCRPTAPSQLSKWPSKLKANFRARAIRAKDGLRRRPAASVPLNSPKGCHSTRNRRVRVRVALARECGLKRRNRADGRDGDLTIGRRIIDRADPFLRVRKSHFDLVAIRAIIASGGGA